MWLALTLVITSYMGIEGIAVTAGEAEHPETSIPRAMRTMVLRLILFYVLAIAVMLMMTPWRELAEGGGSVTGSPFVRAFAAIGIPCGGGAMNLVVISAAVSSANSNLYSTARMLFSLARAGGAGVARGVSPAGVPLACAIAGTGVGAAIFLRCRAGERVSHALRHGCRRHALHLDRDSFHLSASGGRYAGSACEALDQDAGASRRPMVRHRLAGGDFGDHLFVDGLQYSAVSFLPFFVAMSHRSTRGIRHFKGAHA